MSFYFPNFGTVIFRLYMLKKELRKILLSLSFVFVVVVSYAQYMVTGGSGSPMKATQSSGDSADRKLTVKMAPGGGFALKISRK